MSVLLKVNLNIMSKYRIDQRMKTFTNYIIHKLYLIILNFLASLSLYISDVPVIQVLFAYLYRNLNLNRGQADN